MRRNLSRFLIASLCALFVLTSAGLASAVTFAPIATGSTGGTFYPVGVILANTFNKEMEDEGYQFKAMTSGGSTENLEMIRQGATMFAVCGSVPARNAYIGVDNYEGQEIKNVRFVTALWPEAVQLMYREGVGIEKITDLKDKKFSVGPAAGGGVFYMPMILEPFGMSFDSFNAQYMGYGDSVQALQNRLIDGCYLAAGLPTSGVSQLYAGQVAVDMIEFSEEDVARIRELYPFFARVKVAAGTYPKQEEAKYVVGIKSSLISQKSVDPELVYGMLDALYIKHLDEAQQEHGALKTVTLEGATQGLSGAPLHPGAVKFYREHGVEVPEELVPPEMK
ncbi:MAG: TAXI family TRAP transporter solute-binding subunit [Synergistales bacterium]|nr:TAXI family TRAP transporter solute-binding subunit [Synergistales bacterium]